MSTPFNLTEYIKSVDSKFISLNAVPVTSIRLTNEEWFGIRLELVKCKLASPIEVSTLPIEYTAAEQFLKATGKIIPIEGDFVVLTRADIIKLYGDK